MSCKSYTLVNSGSSVINFNYQRCDDALWEYQVELQPNERKKIWLLDNTFEISPYFSQSLVITEINNFPPSAPTPTPTLPVPTTTPTPTPTIAPTGTPVSTPTPTPTITPSSTPIPILLPNDVIFADNITKNIYRLTPSANTIQYLFQSINPSTILDITNTSNKIFINYDNGDVDEYSIISYPFSATYTTTYEFPSNIGVSLFALDNNFLLLGSDKIEKLNLSALTSTTLFSLPTDCVSVGSLLYYPTLDQYCINYYNTISGDDSISLFDSSGSTIASINLNLFTPPVFPDVDELLGIYTQDDMIYGVSYDMNIYEINFSSLSLLGPVQPINLESEKCVGTGVSVDFVSWTLPAPIFEY